LSNRGAFQKSGDGIISERKRYESKRDSVTKSFQGNGADFRAKTAWVFMTGIPAGMRDLIGPFPVVSLRSTTGYNM
jgi:hypothetical protein